MKYRINATMMVDTILEIEAECESEVLSRINNITVKDLDYIDYYEGDPSDPVKFSNINIKELKEEEEFQNVSI